MSLSPRLAVVIAAALLAGAARGEGVSARVLEARADPFPDVGMVMTVSAANLRPVAGLAPAAFAVQEDGASVSGVQAKEETADLAVVLVVDASTAGAGAVAALPAAVAALDRGLSAKAELGLVTFGDKVEVLTEPTRNRARTVAACQRVKADGARALNDGLHRGLIEVASTPNRPVLVLVACGPDRNAAGTALQSTKSLREVAQQARDRKVAVWTVCLEGADQATLAKIALATGGQHYALKSPALLAKVFERLLTDAPRQYRLKYTSPRAAPDGAERAIAVAVTSGAAAGNAVARYRAPNPPPSPSPSPTPGPPAPAGTAAVGEDAAYAGAEAPVGTGIIRFNAYIYGMSPDQRRFCIFPHRYKTADDAYRDGQLRELGAAQVHRVPEGVWKLARWAVSKRGLYLKKYHTLRVSHEKEEVIGGW